jgi:hypothetical protein
MGGSRKLEVGKWQFTSPKAGRKEAMGIEKKQVVCWPAIGWMQGS